jgi:hypothetical protein
MMDNRPAKQRHDTIGFLGLRAQATAVGLLQLSVELIKVGVLDAAAVGRIKQAIFDDLALSRPRSQEKTEYEALLHHRLEHLFSADAAGEES